VNHISNTGQARCGWNWVDSAVSEGRIGRFRLVDWAFHGLAFYLRRIGWRFLLCFTLCDRDDGQTHLEQSGFIDHAIAFQTEAAPVHSVQGLGVVGRVR
jgi:hypothetical protein